MAIVPLPGGSSRFTVIARAIGVVLGLRDLGVDGVPRRFVRARDEQRVTALDDAVGNGGDLIRRLAQAEDDFRESLTNGPVMVDAGETEVLERAVAKLRQQPPMGVVRRDATFAYRVEQGLKLGWCHDAIIRVSLTLPDSPI